MKRNCRSSFVTLNYPRKIQKLSNRMQASYPKKHPRTQWDTLNVEYPVRVLENKDVSSESIARKWRPEPEVLQQKTKSDRDIQEHRDYNTYNECMRSQTTNDFGYKIPEVERFNKHTSCLVNDYIYPLSRRVEDRPPASKVHGNTEMKESYSAPISFSRLISDKDQFKNPVSLESNPIPLEPSWNKELEPLDTTYDGFEKYLDPYLTTNRLHHRPYTADQLNKISNSKDIVTYYTLSDIPWVWSRKPTHDDWFVRVKCPKTMYDREKFKGDFREIRTHNKLNWVPGSFRTEVNDNYSVTHQTNIKMDQHDEVGTKYQRDIGKLKTNSPYEDAIMQGTYVTESSTIGSRKPICSVVEQCVNKNKRLTSRLENKKGQI